MERVALVVGGSVIAPPEPDVGYLRRLAESLLAWARERQLLVVTGGGAPARRAIEAARSLGVGEEALDRIGIAATRLNAQILACVVKRFGGDVNAEVPRTIPEALDLAKRHRILVMGGTQPGHSTDYVAVELAVEGKCARFVNATNVDGVYTRDPAKHRDATHKPSLTFEEMLAIIGEREWTAAGAPGVIDGPSTVLIATKAIPTSVVKGTDLENLGKAVRGEPFHGTRVSGAAVKIPGGR
ncbi:MAG TPA: UMP kinase [Candidatus Thermoplasmatota archaeon]|nr:UMP kinase [Candidatus Thermoplasmatota archaeon]